VEQVAWHSFTSSATTSCPTSIGKWQVMQSRFEMIFFADNESQKCLKSLALLHAQVALTVVRAHGTMLVEGGPWQRGLRKASSKVHADSLQ
jgi:hypothetical protein